MKYVKLANKHTAWMTYMQTSEVRPVTKVGTTLTQHLPHLLHWPNAHHDRNHSEEIGVCRYLFPRTTKPTSLLSMQLPAILLDWMTPAP